MQTVPDLTTELEKRITDLVRGYEAVTGMRIINFHGDYGQSKAMSKFTVTFEVDTRKEADKA